MLILRRLPVTLLELLVVIAILALASGIVAVSINKAVVDQRFRTEVGMIVDELRLAQDLMLILGTDVRVYFQETKDQEGIEFWLELDTIIPKEIEREVAKRRYQLKTIKGVFFEDELLTEVHEGKMDVKFLSNGSVMSKGIMRLATSDSEKAQKGILENYICLRGYPTTIKSSETKEEAEKLCTKSDEAFEEKLTRDTMLRVPDKAKKPLTPESEPAPAPNENVGAEKKNVAETEKKPARKPRKKKP